jgi:cytochrome c
MTPTCRLIPLLLAATAAWLPSAHAADADHGAKVFKEECTECHSAAPGKNKKGPSLFAVAGRAAGGVPDYAYSDAMKNSGITWTADKLDAYLRNPRKLVPGCKMKYDGLDDAGARADLIAYLNNTH